MGVQRGYYKYFPRFLAHTIGEVKLHMINTFYRPQSQNLTGKKNAPIMTWRPGFLGAIRKTAEIAICCRDIKLFQDMMRYVLS